MKTLTIKRPTTAEVRGRHEVEDGTSIGSESRQLKKRITELAGVLADDATITLLRDQEGTAFVLVSGDDRFLSLCILDDGRVGYGGLNHPTFYPTVQAYMEAEDV